MEQFPDDPRNAEHYTDPALTGQNPMKSLIDAEHVDFYKRQEAAKDTKSAAFTIHVKYDANSILPHLVMPAIKDALRLAGIDAFMIVRASAPKRKS